MDWRGLPRFGFGDTPELNNDLLLSTLAGKKTATCWSAKLPGTEVGTRYVILDSNKVPWAVIEVTEIKQVPFNKVTAEHAVAEGARDCSLKGWRDLHRDWLSRNGGFEDNMLLHCIRFKLVERLK